ncbi:MAG: M16 family metallopeptidase, partial [Clostridia bacterium]
MTRTTRSLVASTLIVALSLFSCTGTPQPLPQEKAVALPGGSAYQLADPLPLAPELSKKVLPNGLTYYVRYNGNPAGRILMYLVIASGSSNEEDNELGYAHFVEHMAFNGTKSFPENKLVDYLRSIGMTFGAEINAYTSREETVYTLEMPTDNPEFFTTGLKVLREWATAISFDPIEVEKEKGVILEERRLGLGPHEEALRNELPVMMAGSRHADRDPIGTEESVRNTTAEGLRAFYERNYRADRMAIIAVGDLDVQATTKAVEQEFSFPNPDGVVRPRELFPVAISQEMSFASTFHPDFDRSVVTYSKIVPYDHETTIGDYVDMLTMRIAAEAIKLRLSDLNRSGRMAWQDAFFDDDYFFGGTRLYAFSLTAADGRELEAFSDLAREVERLRRHGFTDSEYLRTMDQWRRWLGTLNVEDNDLRSRGFTDEYVRNFMYAEPVPGVINERVYIRETLDTMKVDKLNAAVKTMLGSDEGFVALRAKSIPATGETSGSPSAALSSSQLADAFEAQLEEARAAQLEAYVAAVGEGGLFDDLPAPGAIAEERSHPNSVTELVLTNGARVLLKPTNYDRDSISFMAWSAGGYTALPVEKQLAAMLAPSLMSSAGLGALDQIRIQELTALSQVSLSWSIGEDATVMDGKLHSKDLETFLRLVYLTSVEPGRDSMAFQAGRDRAVDQIAPFVSAPGYRFESAWSTHLFDGNPRTKGLDPAAIKALDFSDVRDIATGALGKASAFTYVLVGDFKPDEVKALITRHIGAIPAGNQAGPAGNPETPEWIEPMRPRADGGVRVDYPIGREPRTSVKIVWAGEASWSQEREIGLGLMAQALNNRLLDALREELGGIYVSSSQGKFAKTPTEQYVMIVSFDTDPARADELIGKVLSEVASLADGSFPTMYVDQIRAATQRNYDSRYRTNDFWTRNLL